VTPVRGYVAPLQVSSSGLSRGSSSQRSPALADGWMAGTSPAMTVVDSPRAQSQEPQGSRPHPRRALRHGHPAQGRERPSHGRNRDDVGGARLRRDGGEAVNLHAQSQSPLPMLLQHGERVRVRGRRLLRVCRCPSPREGRGEGGSMRSVLPCVPGFRPISTCRSRGEPALSADRACGAGMTPV
jgi:hypothetical protein